jgi:hypothetical protein
MGTGVDASPARSETTHRFQFATGHGADSSSTDQPAELDDMDTVVFQLVPTYQITDV